MLLGLTFSHPGVQKVLLGHFLVSSALAVHHAGWVDWAGLVSSALVSSVQDGWIGLAWLAVPWYPVAVHHAGWVDWAGLVSSALVSSGSPPCRPDGWVGLAWLTVPWYPVTVHHAGWVDWAGLVRPRYLVAVHHAGWVVWAGLVSSALVSSGSPPCRMGGLGWPG